VGRRCTYDTQSNVIEIYLATDPGAVDTEKSRWSTESKQPTKTSATTPALSVGRRQLVRKIQERLLLWCTYRSASSGIP
jgi:hypothetical protein